MKIKSLFLKGLINTLGIAVYITIIVTVINEAGRLKIVMPDYLGPIGMLLLFVLSAAITGGLFVGEPILLYLTDKKKEAVKLFLSTVFWMAIALVVVGAIIIVKNLG